MKKIYLLLGIVILLSLKTSAQSNTEAPSKTEGTRGDTLRIKLTPGDSVAKKIQARQDSLNEDRRQLQNSLNTIQAAEVNAHERNTGTFLDILSNYLQIAAQNITSSNSNLQLKVNWFALNTTDSAKKYQNSYFKRVAWQRNGEFIIDGGMDQTNKINSFQLGINYNVLNRRDTAMRDYRFSYIRAHKEQGRILLDVVNFMGAKVGTDLTVKLNNIIQRLYNNGKLVLDIQDTIKKFIPDLFNGNSSDQEIANELQIQLNKDITNNPKNRHTLTVPMLAEIDSVSDFEGKEAIANSLNDYFGSYGKKQLEFPSFISKQRADSIVTNLNSKVKANKTLHDTLGVSTMFDANKKILANYEDLVQYISKQPLLTFGYLYTYGTGTVLSSHVGGITYLQGIGNFRSTKSGQLTGSLTDTLSSSDLAGKQKNFDRNIITLQAGYNQVLAVRQKVSVIEIKAALEEDYATSSYISTTEKSTFYIDAYLRARLPKTPWLKFDFKYDPKNGNVLGFLNFTYNLDKSN